MSKSELFWEDFAFEPIGRCNAYYCVINMGMDWLCTNTPTEVMSKLYQGIMKGICASTNCSEHSVNISITFEMGSNGNHPHLNVYVQWDDGYQLTVDEFKKVLTSIIESKSKDILILEVDLNNVEILKTYIEKENRERIGTWYDNIIVNSFTIDGKKLDFGLTLSPSQRDRVPNTKHLKQMILPKILDGRLTTDIQIRDFFFQWGRTTTSHTRVALQASLISPE